MFSTHTFILKRRRNILMKDIPLIFGISGVARCGKDTFAKYLLSKLERINLPAVKMSFAALLKQDLDPLLQSWFGISAFTEDPKQKELIRPIFVAAGTDVARKADPDFHIKRLEPKVDACLKNKIISVISDVRFENEARWIQSKGGMIIHITRMGQKPANFYEKANDPTVKRIADYKLNWKRFTEEKETCTYHVNKLFYNYGWTTYGDVKR